MYNRIIFIIFALLAFTACEDKDIKPCAPVTYSDAQPIQFWPIDCDTFNQKEVDGVFSKCFCQPFECSDEIKIQLKDSGYLEDYLLEIVDSDGNSLHNAPLQKTIIYREHTGLDLGFTNETFIASTSPWDQTGAGKQSFQWITNGSIQADGGVSGYSDTAFIGQTRPDNPTKGWPPGTYQVTITGLNLSTGGSGPFTSALQVYASNVSNSEGDFVAAPANGTWDVSESATRVVSFTLTKFYRYIWFSFYKQGPSTGYKVNFFLSEITMNVAPTSESLESYAIYSYSFTPNDIGICDDQVQLIISNNSTPDIEILKSDCIDIRTSWDESILINYSNHSNFAGLDYLQISPDTDFNLRIPAVFFHERFPSEQEVLELSNSQNIQLFAQARAQRLLETGPMPYYMHRKLLLVLQHQFLTIGGQDWVKRENLEQLDSNKRWPLRRATCWLDEKDYIVRNVL